MLLFKALTLCFRDAHCKHRNGRRIMWQSHIRRIKWQLGRTSEGTALLTITNCRDTICVLAKPSFLRKFKKSLNQFSKHVCEDKLIKTFNNNYGKIFICNAQLRWLISDDPNCGVGKLLLSFYTCTQCNDILQLHSLKMIIIILKNSNSVKSCPFWPLARVLNFAWLNINFCKLIKLSQHHH